MALPGKSPDRRPAQLRVQIETRRDGVVGVTLGIDLLGIVQLMLAEELDVVGADGRRITGRAEIRIAFPAADLVAVKGAGVALDRLAERARLGLRAGAPPCLRSCSAGCAGAS